MFRITGAGPLERGNPNHDTPMGSGTMLTPQGSRSMPNRQRLFSGIVSIMAATAYLVRNGREDDVNAIDRVGRVVYPVVFAVFSLIVFLL